MQAPYKHLFAHPLMDNTTAEGSEADSASLYRNMSVCSLRKVRRRLTERAPRSYELPVTRYRKYSDNLLWLFQPHCYISTYCTAKGNVPLCMAYHNCTQDVGTRTVPSRTVTARIAFALGVHCVAPPAWSTVCSLSPTIHPCFRLPHTWLHCPVAASLVLGPIACVLCVWGLPAIT